MEQIELYSKDCYCNVESDIPEVIIKRAYIGLQMIMAFEGHNDSLIKDRTCEFHVLLVLGYMACTEKPANQMVAEYFVNALNNNPSKAISLFEKHIGLNFVVKIHNFFVDKCFYHETLIAGWIYLTEILSPESPIYHIHVSQRHPNLLPIVTFWSECSRWRVEGGSVAFTSIKLIKRTIIKDAFTKWSKHGVQLFYKFESNEAAMSLLLADELYSHLQDSTNLQAINSHYLFACQCHAQNSYYRSGDKKDQEANSLFIKWRDKGDELLSRNEIKKALYFYNSAYTISGGKSPSRQIETCLAKALIKLGEFQDACNHIQSGFNEYSKKDKDIAVNWKDMAKELFTSKQYLLAMNTYRLAYCVTPEDEKLLKRDICSNLSLLTIKEKHFEEARKFAEQCIILDPSWHKGYFRLGIALYEIGFYQGSLKALVDGICRTSDEGYQFNFLLEILKSLLKNSSTSICLKVKISKDVFNKVIEYLRKENKKQSWLSIECLFLNFTRPHYVLTTTFLKQAFEYATSEKFITIILKMNSGNINMKYSESLIEKVLGKDWFDACSKMITREYPCLLFTTKLVIKTGKLQILRTVMESLQSHQVQNSLRNALLYCCEGPCTSTKVSALKLLSATARITSFDFNIMQTAISKKITEIDQRWLLLYPLKEKILLPTANKTCQIPNPSYLVNQESSKKMTSVTKQSTFQKTNATKQVFHALPKKKKKGKKKKNHTAKGQFVNNAMQEQGKEISYAVEIPEPKKIVSNSNFVQPDNTVQELGEEDSNIVEIPKPKKIVSNFHQEIFDFIQTMNIRSVNEKMKEQEDKGKTASVDREQNKANSDEDELNNDHDEMTYIEADAKDATNTQIIDALKFDGLPWEVECTQDAWHILRNKKLNPIMKKKIIGKIKMLASGHWRRDLAKRLEGVKNGIQLFEAKINESSRILWEIAISFSARCSMMQMQQLASLNIDDTEKGAIYVNKIRIWNIALQHDDVPKMIENIENSHDRGQACIIRKQLKCVKKNPTKSKHEKLPNVYINENLMKEKKVKSKKSESTLQHEFIPPASPKQQEYHILKLYTFSSAMASRILSLEHSHYDFPFQVSELEHAVIHLEPENKCSVLLLGRSGTGKTTCCLYRLWAHYQNYWNAAQHSGPHIPKFVIPKVDDGNLALKEDEKHKDSLEFNQQSLLSNIDEEEPDGIYPCLCSGACNCEEIPKKVPEEDIYDALEYSYEIGGEIRRPEPIEECDKISNGDDGNDDGDDGDQNNNCEHLRQLLVTKNEVLCNEIKKNFAELCYGSTTGNIQKEEDIEFSKLEDIPPDAYPLFITSNDLLLLLDSSLDGESFFKRDDAGQMIQNIPGWGKYKSYLSHIPLLDDDGHVEDEEDDDEDDDVGDNIQFNADVEDNIQLKKNHKKKNVFKKYTEITYEVFYHEIWPQITRGKFEACHPSLVWMEIKSFIKGCAESFLNDDTGYLTKAQYMDNIGRKQAPNFTGNRDDIYHLFEKYTKIKVSLGYFDEMDVHFNIYKRLKVSLIPDWGFHQIYVDEVQDFTQAELLLLLRCSLNPNALFFTGDTAQSIMNGVAFRFCDIQTLLHVAKNEFEQNKMISPVVVPKQMHQLTHNYRSHSGILQLASVIVQFLKILFPESFDHHLRPDVGLFPGPKPVILDTEDFTELAMLLQGTRRETSTIEFGAHQAVLVQTEKSKEELPAELSCGLVLSIYEAKGLEFDDVLLYNFFKDSPACDEWRVITSNINKLKQDEISESSLTVLSEDMLQCESRPLDFDKNKHKLLNAELKKLYTAITRARVNVWIYDEDKKKRAPVFDLLIKKSLVDVVRLDDSNEKKKLFAEKSTNTEWENQGHRFYSKRLWKLALKCAERACDIELKQKCVAQIQGSYAQEVAYEWKLKKTQLKKSNVYLEYRKAALLFLKCGLIKEAETCLWNSKEWLNLGIVYEKQEKVRHLYTVKTSLPV